jgi:cob(I)alamin adenosyltransferase
MRTLFFSFMCETISSDGGEYNRRSAGMSITTRKGDQGYTSTWAGEHVYKHDPRIEACGTIDELVSALGVARSFLHPESETATQFMHIQRLLFHVGSMISGMENDEISMLFSDEERQLSLWCRDMESKDGLPKDFILPGATQSGAAIDLARSISRRCERRVLAVDADLPASCAPVFAWLNRLSDYLWLKAREQDDFAGGSHKRSDDQLSGADA